MRKKTFYLIGSISCLCWIVIVCYLFVHKPPGKIIKLKDVSSQVEQLEKDLKGQLNSNKVLINSLRSLKRQLSGTGKDAKTYSHDDNIAVLLFSCNRVTVRRNLDQLLKYRPDPVSFPIIVSQDCGHEPTRKVLQSYGDQITLIRHPDLSDIPLTGKEKKFKGYYKIARHYAWALNQTFNLFNYNTVIIVEDDLDIAPDFFEYFRATYTILLADPTLWCVSAWNDNGKEGLIAENSADTLYRSDFFPGLGWMMTKNVWLEFADKWPKAFWDDWIRQPAQRKDRACIRPEVSRTKTFGKVGVSNGLFFEKHLKFIKLNEQFVPFTKYNLTYLLKDNYDDWFIKTVYGSPPVSVTDLAGGSLEGDGPVRLTYRSKINFKSIAKAFRLMDDFKVLLDNPFFRATFLSFWPCYHGQISSHFHFFPFIIRNIYLREKNGVERNIPFSIITCLITYMIKSFLFYPSDNYDENII